MVIFHSYVSLPEGTQIHGETLGVANPFFVISGQVIVTSRRDRTLESWLERGITPKWPNSSRVGQKSARLVAELLSEI